MVTTLYLNHLGSFDAENQHSWIPLACTDSEQDKLRTRKEMANLRVTQWGSPLFVTWLAFKKSGFICTQGFEHHVWNYHPQQQFIQTPVRCLLFPFAYSIQLFLSEDQPPDWCMEMGRKIEEKEDAKAIGSQRCKDHYCKVLLHHSFSFLPCSVVASSAAVRCVLV